MKPWTKTAGLIAATLTPMKKDGSVNYDIIPKYIDHLLSIGVTEVFVNGTAAEHGNLTTIERKQLAESWMTHGKGKLTRVIMHIGGPNLTETKEMAAHAESIGVDCVACVLPTYYIVQTISQMIDYLSEVARACPDTPFMYYHFPDITRVTTPLHALMAAAAPHIPTLIGAKHTSINLMDAVLAKQGDKFDIAIGADTHFLGALAMGIKSSVGIGYSVYGAPFVRLLKAFNEGRLDEARKEQNRVNDFWLMSHRNGDVNDMIAAFKAVMGMLGLDFGPPRLPIQPYSSERTLVLEQQLRELGFFDWLKPTQ